MIRFSAALVVVGLGLLLTGAISSELPLVYAAIAVSVVAAVILAVGVFVGRDRIFGAETATAPTDRGHARHAAHRSQTIPASVGARLAGAATSNGALRAGNTAVAQDQAGQAQSDQARADQARAGQEPAGTVVTVSSGLGWPPGTSPADELWARVDEELSAAGAAATAPRLTKQSPADEVWGRVEQELTLPTQWNPTLSGWRADEETASRPAEAADEEPPGRAEVAEAPHSEDVPPGDVAAADDEGPTDEAAEADETPEPAVEPEDAAEPDEADAVADPDAPEVTDATAEASPPQNAPEAGQDPAPADEQEDRDSAAATAKDSNQKDSIPNGATPAQPAPESPASASTASGDTASGSAVSGGTASGGTASGGTALGGPKAASTTFGSTAAGLPQRRRPGDPAAAGPGSGTGPSVTRHSQNPFGLPAASRGNGTAAPSGSVSLFGLPKVSAPGGADDAMPQGPVVRASHVAIVPGVARYHRSGCILIRFLADSDVESVTREAAEDAGCVPCRACQPDKPSADAD